jgi:hypothetical protein
MSKWIFAVCGLILCMAAVAVAQDHYSVYQHGSGALYGAVNDPYSRSVPSGMRFGDAPHTASVEFGSGNCQTCAGVQPPPCDPCWRGPCIDWKLIGWYSHWGPEHGGHGCHKRCCLKHCRADCDTGACVPGTTGDACPTCQ